jgi:DNA polymerase-3 subunit gamma/tau
MNQDLREKYRPKAFSEVVGNGRVIKQLTNLIKSGATYGNILLHGPTGSGKTTLARILVKAVLCRNFGGDVCGVCNWCSSFDRNFPKGSDYFHHDCSKMAGKELDEVLRTLPFRIFSETGRQIHIFDEFGRTKEPLQEKFLVPMEVYKDMDILLIFCLIDLTNIIQPFRDRVDVFKMKPPEIDELIPWLRKICAAEGITVRDNNALKQVAVSADRLPRACLSLLQQAYFLGEPLSTSLVKELAQDIQGSVDRGPQYTPAE